MPDPAETFHPMEYVLDELEARRISPHMAGRMLSRMVNLSLCEWMAFIGGGPMTKKLAIGLSELFGTSVEVWLKLQRAYDQTHSIQRVDHEALQQMRETDNRLLEEGADYA